MKYGYIFHRLLIFSVEALRFSYLKRREEFGFLRGKKVDHEFQIFLLLLVTLQLISKALQHEARE
jgi:hypothetical protein